MPTGQRRKAPELYVDDVGTRFIVRIFERDDDGELVALDLSATTGRTLRLQKPDRTSIDRTMDGLDLPNGVLEYTTAAGDIDQPGLWWFQVLIVTGATRDQATNQRSFVVGDRLETP